MLKLGRNLLIIGLSLQVVTTINTPVSAYATQIDQINSQANSNANFGFSTKQVITIASLLETTNAARLANHQPPLLLNQTLIKAAELKAQDMQKLNYWDHYNPINHKAPWDFIKEAGYYYKAAGENLARGYVSAEGTTTGWLNSPSHRANLLSDQYQDVGYAIFNAYNDQNQLVTVVVQLFGSR